MPLNDLIEQQRAGVEIGRIRLGEKIVANGKTSVRRLDTFRLTTPSLAVAESVAQVYGGTVRRFETHKWEVITSHRVLDVVIPPAEVITQWWELWLGAQRERQCDGITMKLPRTQPCMCPKDIEERMVRGQGNNPTACKPFTRLRVSLPYVADVGVWLVQSRGLGAAKGLGSKALLLQAARDAGVSLRAQLLIDDGGSRSNGQTKKWVEPKLFILDSVADIQSGRLALEGGLRLPPPPAGYVAAIEAAAQPERVAIAAGPTPLASPQANAQDLAEMAATLDTRAAVEELAGFAKKLDLAEDMVTIDPARQVFQELHSVLTQRWKDLPAEQPATPEPPAPDMPALITDKQQQRMHILLGEAGITDREEKLLYYGETIKRPVESSKELTEAEASVIIAKLDSYVRAEEPPADIEEPTEETF